VSVTFEKEKRKESKAYIQTSSYELKMYKCNVFAVFLNLFIQNWSSTFMGGGKS